MSELNDRELAKLRGLLASGLEHAADPDTRAWWEGYLRHEAKFRGVKMATTRKLVNALWREHELGQFGVRTALAIATDWMAQPHSEDKLAGVLLLAEHALGGLELEHVPALAKPLSEGLLADWNVVDWYCVKLLGPFVGSGMDQRERALAVAGWRTTAGLWQRRAAAVAFVSHAAAERELFPGFSDMLLEVCAANVADPTRWSQTSVGWLLRELSRRSPDVVRGFCDEHPELSREARKNALKYL